MLQQETKGMQVLDGAHHMHGFQSSAHCIGQCSQVAPSSHGSLPGCAPCWAGGMHLCRRQHANVTHTR